MANNLPIRFISYIILSNERWYVDNDCLENFSRNANQGGIEMASFKEYTTKKGEKRWRFQTYLGIDPATGKSIKTTKQGFKTYKAAKVAERQLQIDFMNGKHNKIPSTLYKDLYIEWIEIYKKTVKPNTLAIVEMYFRLHVLPAFGDLKIEKIDKRYCQKVMNEWGSKYKHYSQLKMNACRVFEYAKKMGIITDNPLDNLEKVQRRTDSHEPDYYNKQELESFLNCLEKENKPQVFTFFRLLAFTGMRKGEALALTWDDINFEEKTINIDKTLYYIKGKVGSHSPKTKSSKRVISIDEITVQCLKKWRMKQRESLLFNGINAMKKGQLIFSTQNNKPISPSNTSQFLRPSFYKKHNLKRIKIHEFRHTHCSLLFEAGATIKEVQVRLGHSDVKTTMDIYTHVSKTTQEHTVEKLSNYLAF